MQNVYKKDSTTLNLLQDVDVVYGTNENGSYIKLSNGAIIQYGMINVDLRNWIKTGDTTFYYSDNYYVEFPIEFIGEYSITGVSNNGNLIWIYSIIKNSQKISSINLFTIRNRNSEQLTNYKIQWIAVGRWK